ncbi:DNA-3-methyladenine glycosylase-like [Tropilaelaps mercedesae]|uniref:DNA-3-methyladenine glycosylase n=1 Tax=Tropilaelaps mercedesae TaxID=418985 RepID=A0A1V9X9J8_9ACAR|nr:DNA-3-methyladenine glycosylase-like [Tropilaelaps mercedesae]
MSRLSRRFHFLATVRFFYEIPDSRKESVSSQFPAAVGFYARTGLAIDEVAQRVARHSAVNPNISADSSRGRRVLVTGVPSQLRDQYGLEGRGSGGAGGGSGLRGAKRPAPASQRWPDERSNDDSEVDGAPPPKDPRPLEEAHLKNALDNCRHFLAIRTPARVGREFFDVGCVQLARSLLGAELVRRLTDGTLLRAKIVETESYPGGEDRASHSFNGRRTERNEPMYMEPGTAYVYLTYGMYYCFNISSRGDGAAVLLRSAKPLVGLDRMRQLRGARRKDNGSKLRANQLLNGPSKLCMGMAIEKESMNKEFVPSSELLWVEFSQEGGAPAGAAAAPSPQRVVTSKRVGIDSAAPEWAQQPLRFYLLDEAGFVSVRDHAAEKAFAL